MFSFLLENKENCEDELEELNQAANHLNQQPLSLEEEEDLEDQTNSETGRIGSGNQNQFHTVHLESHTCQ